ncbi:hypothetical protein [Thermoleptolyngbya sp. C42_A2020_037]|uniref:hypothetical protein n=1 Tax=Thermoleptolyngbya sp. C42_A2020_037 TaxID=2747799 RepID=UPI0019E544F1|nr:hypothetical protein [Thermoleptolyngbya sp. C42_A2020_037]MBF2083713.1 hypothetical protein [Thermoleptolyngbya sp. C42_A2020_037]
MQRGVSLRDRPPSANTNTSGRSPSSGSTRTSGRSPSSLSTRTSGRSPPGYLLGRCTLTEVYRCSTFAADPKAVGSVRLDPDLEELSLCKWGANRLPTDKLTEPER